MAKSKRLNVTRSVTVYDLPSRLRSLRDQIDQWIHQYGEDSVLTVESSGYDNLDLRLEWNELESDDEYNARMERNKKAAASKRKSTALRKQKELEDERKLYEKLKAKFE